MSIMSIYDTHRIFCYIIITVASINKTYSSQYTYNVVKLSYNKPEEPQLFTWLLPLLL